MSQPSLPIRRFARIIAVAATLGALAVAGPALAQTATQPAPAAQPAGTVAPNQIPIIVGVLDTQAILNASSAGKSLNTQWDAAMKALDDDMESDDHPDSAPLRQADFSSIAFQPTSSNHNHDAQNGNRTHQKHALGDQQLVPGGKALIAMLAAIALGVMLQQMIEHSPP